MRQTVPSHPVIAIRNLKNFLLFFCAAIVFFTPNDIKANDSSFNHKEDLVISFTFVPADITVDCNNVPGAETPAIQDNCPGDITVNLNETSNQSFNGSCTDFTYNITRTWTATNGCGEVASASQTVSVRDQRPPVLSAMPADITLFQSDGATIPVNDVTAFDDCDGNVTLEFLEGIGGGACSQSIGRTWIATDACGNSINHSQQITYIVDWFLIADVMPQTCDQLGSISMRANNGSGDYITVWQDFEGNTTTFQGGLAAGDYFLYVVDEVFGCKEEITVTVPEDCNQLGCSANAGTITANGGVSCQQFAGEAVNISATPNGNMTVPPGFQTTYVLTLGGGLVIQDAQSTPNFTVSNPGAYTIHTLVFDPNTLDLGIIQLGVTTGFDVNGLLQQGGGGICASLDVTGAGVVVSTCNTSCATPIVDNIVIVESTCGNSVGTINITMTTANRDFSYTWSPAVSSNNSAANLVSGAYTVTIASNVDPACTITETIVVGNSDGPQGEIVSIIPANCSDASGQVVMGPANLSFDWGTAGVATGNQNERINLFAGDYQVTVTDPNIACVNIINVTVEQENNINGGFLITLEPDVNQSNGQVIITTEGGSLYNYAWSDGFQTQDPNRFDLDSRNWCVTITDTQSSGCEDIVCFVLPENNPNCNASISLASDVISVGCIGDANATVMFTTDFQVGCAQPPSTEILDVNGNVVANGNLAAGNYCVVLSDGNGSIVASECFEVVESNQLVLDIQRFDVTCFAGGSILLDVTGGSAPYTYAWDDLVSSQDRTNLQARTYVVTVTDINGCQAVSPPIVINETCQNFCVAPTINEVVVVESTCDNSDGYVEIGLFEDVGSYSFTWSPDIGTPNFANNARTGVPAGSYTVTIIDNADPNCGVEIVAVVGNSNGPEASVLATFPATCTENNGTATIVPSNFDYTWSDGGPSLDVRMDLPAGTYQVTVVDPNGTGCINVLEVEIGSLSPLLVVVNPVTLPDCGQSNGLVIVGAFGGTNNYTYEWSDGIPAPDPMQPGTRPNLAAGSYCVTVTDIGNLGCETEECFVLLNNVADNACATINMASDTIFTTCPGMNDGNAVFTTDFCPNFANPATTQIFHNGNVVNNGSLSPGEYCIVVSDGGGCLVGESCFTVLDRENIDLDIEITPISCITGGIINVIASGGNGGYTYQWDPVFPDQSRITNLGLGTYSVTVTDANGCSSSASNLTITNACAACDPFFTTDSMNLIIDCDLGGELCLDIPFANFQNTTVEDNFMEFDGQISGCNFDSTSFYSTAAIPEFGANGPYTITNWSVVLNGMPFDLGPQAFNTIGELVNQMNGWDPTGNWVFDPVNSIIEGGDNNNDYGTIFIVQDATGSVGQMALDFNAIPLGTGLTFEEGQHTLVLSDSLTGCSDTLELTVVCDVPLITTETLYDTIQIIGGPFELCADTTELPGNIVDSLTQNICPLDSGNEVDFTFDEESFCVTYEGIGFGTDPYCLVFCDDQGFCDTTFFIVTILPGDGDPPMLNPDEVETIKNVPIVISVAENDMRDDWIDFGIVDQPENGDALQNEISETITYSPELDFCGEDQFTYFFTNESGSDTTTVFVTVSCECLIIYDGISPNGDGINDGWIIDGIENFPNSEVCVYNRWGNQVFRKRGYVNNNPFTGTWEGLDLPSGTYFYVIDTGDGGQKFDGILQINR